MVIVMLLILILLSVSIYAGAVMLSRITAKVPTAEPDGAVFQNFYQQMVLMFMVLLMSKIMQITQ